MENTSLLKFYADKKVLVTGHTGFIGTWLTKWLQLLGARVCGFSLGPNTEPNMFEAIDFSGWLKDVRGDVRNRELLEETINDFGPDIVFHLAAQPLVLDSYEIPFDTFDINVTGTAGLLDILRRYGKAKSIVVMTSDKVYKNDESSQPFSEDDTLGGRDPYSASKSCEDIVTHSYAESYFKNMHIGISSVRCGNIIGGGDWSKNRIVADIIRGISHDKKVYIRNPAAVRPWQYVLDPLGGILKLAERMLSNSNFSGAWNFGPMMDTPVTVGELSHKIISIWGRGELDLGREESGTEAKYLRLDIEKSKRELEWRPLYDISKSLRETVRWYRTFYDNRKEIDSLTSSQIEEYMRLENKNSDSP